MVLACQAGAALAAGLVGVDQDEVADGEPLDFRPEADDAGRKLVPHNGHLTVGRHAEEAGPVLVQVRAADTAVAYSELEVARARLRLGYIDKLHPTDSLKRDCLHCETLLLRCARII
jgi:hypothetical protein